MNIELLLPDGIIMVWFNFRDFSTADITEYIIT